MATLTVSGSGTYNGIPTDVDTIQFTNAIHTVAIATFAASDFDDVRIHDDVVISGSAGANHIVVNGGSLNAQNWTFNDWSDPPDSIKINGSSGNDTILGSVRDDTITGGLGADVMSGGSGDDTFIYNGVTEFQSGEVVNGAAGTGDTLRLNTNSVSTIDFSAPGALNNVEKLVFASAGIGRFAGADFGTAAGRINTVTGSIGFDRIELEGSVVNLSGVVFIGWTTDVIILRGTVGGDTLTGSNRNDAFTGGSGGDTLRGGDGDDTFVYFASSDLAAGETIDGGGGTTDVLSVNLANPGDQIDFSGAGVLAGVEKLGFSTAGQARFSGVNIGTAPGLINAVFGALSGANTVNVFGSAVDLSGVAFSNWTAGEDTINISGTGGNDTLIGSNLNDNFSMTGGVDSFSGSAGNDRFTFKKDSTVAGTVVDGGSGNADTINLQGGDLRLLTITSVEELDFSNRNSDLFTSITAAGNQIRAGAIDTVSGSLKEDFLTVSGAAVDLSGVTFTNWVEGSDHINLRGSNAANSTLIGSSLRDVLAGGNRNDTLNGRGGLDILGGGFGNDTYVLGAENDTVSEEGGIDTVTSTITRNLTSFNATIENLTLLGNAAVKGLGNGAKNVLDGSQNSAGNLLVGRLGNDTYVIGARDTVNEKAGGGGIDTVQSLVNHTLAANVEKLFLLGSAISGTGNNLANILTGNAKGNVLNGALGNDKITGGFGKDTLTGAAGNDHFVYNLQKDSRGAAADIIRDFDDFGDDRVNFSALVGGKLIYKGLGPITGIKQVHINDIAGPDLLVEVNLAGSIAPEVIVRLAATAAADMTLSDFIL